MTTQLKTILEGAARGFRSGLNAFKKGWRENWARGTDLDGGGPGVRLTNAAQQSAWVFRCLQLTAGPVRCLDVQWMQTSARGKESEVKDRDLLEFWRRPAVTVSGRLTFGDFVELTMHWENLHGQAFWILDDSWLDSRAAKSPILLARADRMMPMKTGDELVGWRFLDGRKAGYNLLPEQVIRPRFLNPYDDAAGLAPLEAARIAADADYAAAVFARNVARSNGDQGVYVISKSGALDSAQQAQILAQLRQKARLASQGQYKAAFLTGDVSIEDPKIKTVDAAFISGREQSRHEIAVAFGVPPSMMDRMDSYSVGAASDRFRLIEETCVPHANRIAECMAQVERRRSGRDLEARFDWSDNPTLAQARNERFKVGIDAWKTGIPWDVLNGMLKLGLDPFPGSAVGWMPMSLEPVDVDGGKGTPEPAPAPTAEPAEPEDEPDAAGKTRAALLAQRSGLQELQTLIGSLNAPTTPGTAKAGDEADTAKPERLQKWKAHMAARGPSEKLFKSKFNKCLMEARKETLAKIESSGKNLAGVRTPGVLELIFSLVDFTLNLQREMRKAHEDALTKATGQLLLELGLEDNAWTMASPDVLAFLDSRDNLMKDVAREVFDDIEAQLQEGLSKGDTLAELAGRVRAAFNEVSDARAYTIAATETGAAYGNTRHLAIEDLEIPFKQWLSAQDGKVRDTHRRIDGTVVAANEPFRVLREDGGEDLMQHPCDAAGSAGNCINCRCVEIPMMAEDVPETE